MKDEARTRIEEEIISALTLYMFDDRGIDWTGIDLYRMFTSDTDILRTIIESYKKDSLEGLSQEDFSAIIMDLAIGLRWKWGTMDKELAL